MIYNLKKKIEGIYLCGSKKKKYKVVSKKRERKLYLGNFFFFLTKTTNDYDTYIYIYYYNSFQHITIFSLNYMIIPLDYMY